eukprot:2807558-Amphidinium_carterae.2
MGQEEAEEELGKVKVAPWCAPPTAEEVEEHEASGHAQFRSWCPSCVAGRTVLHHRAVQHEEEEIPTVAIDYAYLAGEANSESSVTMLIGVDSRTKMLLACSLPQKGVEQHACDQLCNFLKRLGHSRLILKSDGEPAIKALKAAALAALGGAMELILEESPRGDHRANGLAENAVRQVKDLTRTLILAVEAHLQQKLPARHPLVLWAPRHAAWSINCYRVGKDGKTPEQRRSGRKWRKPSTAYGELIHGKLEKSKRDLDAKTEDGLFLGYSSRTSAVLLLMQSVVVQAQGMARHSQERQWSYEIGEFLTGLPWSLSAAEAALAASVAAEANLPVAVVPVVPKPTEQRQFYVRRENIEKYGATVGCKACAAILAGQTKMGGISHSAECRARILAAMKAEGEVRATLYDDEKDLEEPGWVEEDNPEALRLAKRYRELNPNQNPEEIYRYGRKRRWNLQDLKEDVAISEERAKKSSSSGNQEDAPMEVVTNPGAALAASGEGATTSGAAASTAGAQKREGTPAEEPETKR